jgi:hypothetical protein
MGQNCLQDALAIEEHLIVPETKHRPALSCEIGVTGIISVAFGMLETIRLDDQLGANTKKVDNIRSDRNLPAKLEAIQATIAQKTP